MSRSVTVRAFEAYIAKRVELGDAPGSSQWSLLREPLRSAWEAALEVPLETIKQLQEALAKATGELDRLRSIEAMSPVPMLLWCPECGQRHVDRGKAAEDAHHTHACQHCGHVWKPAKIRTVGVQFLPGYRDDEP